MLDLLLPQRCVVCGGGRRQLCAGCREEREKPPDPFRILKPEELVPLAPVSMTPVGYYAYKITWSDGHDTGLYTLENLRELCQCPECTERMKKGS